MFASISMFGPIVIVVIVIVVFFSLRSMNDRSELDELEVLTAEIEEELALEEGVYTDMDDIGETDGGYDDDGGDSDD